MPSVRALLAKRDDPYAGADMENAKRLGALLWVMGAAIGLALVPLAPPTKALERGGYAIGAVVLASAVLGARMLLRGGPKMTYNRLLATSYVAAGQISLMDWLAGGLESPYTNLYMIPLFYAAGAHPPRRALPLLATVGLAASAPLLYDGWNTAQATDIAVQLVLWFAGALALMVLMSTVRAQRVGLWESEEKAQRLARLDVLTGLGNRRAFDEGLAGEIARARRTGRPLSVAIADLDDFKVINDRFGHLSGDCCLRTVADTLRAAARQTDTCFRWGGDEFVVLLPETDYAGAEQVGERLRSAVGRACLRPDDVPLTIACGVAELTEEANADDFLAAADLALMSLKTPSATEDRESAELTDQSV